ncbi:restriction endonuclease subunit S [Cellulosimicrobium cellulans]
MAEHVRIAALMQRGILTMGDGYRTKRSEHGQPGHRIIRVADVRDGNVFLDGDDFVSDEYTPQMGAKVAIPGDVLLTTKGTVGRVAVMPVTDEPAVYSPQLCYFRIIDRSVLDPGYLRYWFGSQEFLAQASFLQGNTDMAPYISLSDLRAATITLPSLPEQTSIAAVLGVLDDKIAANTRLAAIADALASARFDKAVEGTGMSEESFADVAHVGGGATPRSKVPEFWDGGVRWLTPTDVTALPGPYVWETKRTISEKGLAAISSSLYPRGTIFMTSRATIGAFAIAEEPMAANQGFIALQPRDGVSRYWLFHEMRSRVPEFLDHANGATFLELSRGNFKKLRVRRLSIEAERRFEAEARVLHERASAALRENSVLSATRDTLLPQLMSGKLRVREAAEMAGL